MLATNVAETSLTVPGIRFVVDSGLARISRYSVRAKCSGCRSSASRKPAPISARAAAAAKRKGICIRLYSEEDFALREDYTPPEVLRTNLASVILRMAALGLGEPESSRFSIRLTRASSTTACGCSRS